MYRSQDVWSVPHSCSVIFFRMNVSSRSGSCESFLHSPQVSSRFTGMERWPGTMLQSTAHQAVRPGCSDNELEGAGRGWSSWLTLARLRLLGRSLGGGLLLGSLLGPGRHGCSVMRLPQLEESGDCPLSVSGSLPRRECRDCRCHSVDWMVACRGTGSQAERLRLHTLFWREPRFPSLVKCVTTAGKRGHVWNCLGEMGSVKTAWASRMCWQA